MTCGPKYLQCTLQRPIGLADNFFLMASLANRAVNQWKYVRILIDVM